MNSCLATNIFDIGFVKRANSKISFYAGQPLGSYSSWALFAFAHHVLVWICANRVYPGRHFTDYAVLGDDILIADKAVADEYADQIGKIGVQISTNKSPFFLQASSTGCIEFAKRFVVALLIDRVSKDISPISCRCLVNYLNPMGLYGLARQYGFRRLSTYCRVGGIGYRNLSSVASSKSLTVTRMIEMFHKANLTVSWWLGRGRPLNPYLTGHLILILRQE